MKAIFVFGLIVMVVIINFVSKDNRPKRSSSTQESININEASCRNQNNDPVSWWFIFKFPSIDNTSMTGYEYLYLDSEGADIEQFGNIGNSALEYTKKVYINNPAKNDLFFMSYNDKPKRGQHSSGYAHAKGFLFFENTQGAFVQHSIPYFSGDKPTYTGSHLYSQHAFCMTINKEQFETLSEPLCKIGAFVQKLNIPPRFANFDWLDDMDKRAYKDANETEIRTLYFQTGDDTKITIFFKTLASLDQLWHAVYEHFKIPMVVQTWIRGRNTNGYDYSNIFPFFYQARSKVRFIGDTFFWVFTKDHAKIGYSRDEKDALVCMGDLNYSVSQTRTSGMILCFKNTRLWNLFAHKLDPLLLESIRGTFSTLAGKLRTADDELVAAGLDIIDADDADDE